VSHLRRQIIFTVTTATTSLDKDAINKLPRDKYTPFWAYSQSFMKIYKYIVIYPQVRINLGLFLRDEIPMAYNFSLRNVVLKMAFNL
jgi:hypothetical protein